MDIIFIEVPNYPFYFAGSDGSVYSCKGIGAQKDDYNRAKRKLKGCITGDRYAQVVLCNKLGCKSFMIHNIITRAFLGPKGKRMTVSHINGDKYDNRIENLTYESYSKNLSRKKDHGTDDVGYNNSRSKINKQQLIEIRGLLSKGVMTHKDIGRAYGVNRVFISKINNGSRYKNQ